MEPHVPRLTHRAWCYRGDGLRRSAQTTYERQAKRTVALHGSDVEQAFSGVGELLSGASPRVGQSHHPLDPPAKRHHIHHATTRSVFGCAGLLQRWHDWTVVLT